jgi:hypothetical protein
MSWFGTDVRALACIVVGATLGGAATWALVDARAVHADCVVEARAHSPRIVVTGQGDVSTVLVAPNVQVRTHKRCGGTVSEIVDVHVDRHIHLEHLQEMEELELHLELMEQELELKLEALEIPGPEFAFELQHDIQAEIELEMEKVKEELKKLHSGG